MAGDNDDGSCERGCACVRAGNPFRDRIEHFTQQDVCSMLAVGVIPTMVVDLHLSDVAMPRVRLCVFAYDVHV